MGKGHKRGFLLFFLFFFKVCTTVFILYHLWCNQISTHTCTLPLPLSLFIHPSLLAPFFFFFFCETVAFNFATLEFAKPCMLFVPSPCPPYWAVLVILMLSHEGWDLCLQSRVCIFFCWVPWDAWFHRGVSVFFNIKKQNEIISHLWNHLVNSHRLKATQREAGKIPLRFCSFCCNFVFHALKVWVVSS